MESKAPNKNGQEKPKVRANPEVVSGEDVETLAERRYLWTARAFAIVCAVSFCCNLILVIAIFQIIPLIRYEPYLLKFHNKDEQVVEIAPMPDTMQNKQVITENMVRRYIIMRNTMSGVVEDMRKNWLEDGCPMQEMSSKDVYRYFVANTAQQGIKTMEKLGLTVKIKISNVTESDKNIWRVVYEAYTLTPDLSAPDVTQWEAILQIAYIPKKVVYKERLKNPLGFTVVKYQTKQRK